MRSFFAIVLTLLAAVPMAADGQSPCPGGVCPMPSRGAVVPSKPPVAVCRIHNQTASQNYFGTGTLVATTSSASYVLTCHHLFAAGEGTIRLAFAGRSGVTARLVAADKSHDLAVLAIPRSSLKPIALDPTDPNGLLRPCGFGTTGQFRLLQGPVVGYATPEGAEYRCLRIAARVEHGDSGGPVLTGDGRLAGVIWGMRAGETYATYGIPIRRLLEKVLARSANSSRRMMRPVTAPPITVPATQPPKNSNRASCCIELERRLGVCEQQLRLLPTRDDFQQLRNELLRPSTEESEPNSHRLSKVSYAKLLAAALGISTPVGLGIVFAGGLLARRAQRRVRGSGGPRRRRFPPKSQDEP